MWSSCFWFCISLLVLVLLLLPLRCLPVTHHLSHTTLSHPSLSHTHNFVTHHLSHTTLSHTIFHAQLCHTQLCHAQLCYTPSFTHNCVTHLFVTHHLSHTTLSHTTSFVTHNFVTHKLYHTFFNTNLLPHTIFQHKLSHTVRGRRGTWWHRRSICVAGVALGDVYGVASMALVALGWLWWRAWDAAALCVAGVALVLHPPSHIHLRFAWQAWRLAKCTCVWRGRCGTCGTGLALVACLVAALVTRPGRRGTLRGGRGTRRHWRPICAEVVALGDIYLRLAWQVWHLSLVARLVAVSRPERHGTLRGRHGAWWHRRSICVASLALGDIDVPFAWQAWHLATCTCVWSGRRGTCGTCGTGLALMARLVAVSRPGRRGSLRGRRGAWWHRRSICVAGVALVLTSTFGLRGRRGAWRNVPAFGVAGVALVALGWLWWRAWSPR